MTSTEWFGEGAEAGAFSTAITSAFVSFFATKLGSMVVEPQTQAASVLSSLGAAAGALGAFPGGIIGQFAANTASSFFGSAAYGAVKALFSAIPGTFIGFVLGAFIGNLFGKKKPRVPEADAEVLLQAPLARYELGASSAANGGNLQLVESMAITARDTLNGLIAVITDSDPDARVSNTYSPTQTYGHTGNQLWIKYDANLNGSIAGSGYLNVVDWTRCEVVGVAAVGAVEVRLSAYAANDNEAMAPSRLRHRKPVARRSCAG